MAETHQRHWAAALLWGWLAASTVTADVLFAADAARKPNVIVFFTDDHGFADLSCQGVLDDIRTPHIDALAKGGVRMESGYVTAPQCVPSRAGLLIGKHQNRFGVESNGRSLEGFNAERTIAERLKDAGYATGMTGKWHLGPVSEIVDHGFDDVFAKSSGRPGWSNFGLDGEDRKGGAEPTKLYHIDANTEAACAFIRRHREQPFFFYCAYRAPHVPLDAPPKYLGRHRGPMPERRRQALAMLSAVDDGVGKVMATLRDLELEENTLIFFIGDNGAPLKIHKYDAPGGGPGWDGSLNDPLNGEKGMLSEGGIRVPFVAAWKGVLPAGVKYLHPVTSLDVAATAASVAGLTDAGDLDGVDVVPALREGVAAHQGPLYWRWIAQAAVREGKWKYLRGGEREYLFDLDVDPEEKTNVIAAHSAIAKGLEKKLTSWSQQLKPPGLNNERMSKTWEQYFDFYLDGKPAPPLNSKSEAASTVLQGWVVRNGKAEISKNALQLTGKSARGLFIAQAGLSIQGPASVSVSLSVSGAGNLGVAWREEGQKDFPPQQVITKALKSSQTGQQVVLKLPTTKKIIHLRLLAPWKALSITSVRIEGQGGAKGWVFAK